MRRLKDVIDVDSRGRVTLPNTEPGARYLIEEHGGVITLTPVEVVKAA